MIVYVQFFAELSERWIVKLSSIVRYENSRDSESAYDSLPYKSPYVLFSNCCEQFSFHPFSEVADPYYQKFNCFRPTGKGPKISNPHYVKGQGAVIEVSTFGGEWIRFMNF